MSLEIEVTYAVQYQKPGDPTWYEFTGRELSPIPDRSSHETADLGKAQDVAKRLLDGDIKISTIPKYQHPVTATLVIQRIMMGGTIITYGQPQERA